MSTCAGQIHIAEPPPNVANTTNCYTELHNWTLPAPHAHTPKHTLSSFYVSEAFLGEFWFHLLILLFYYRI